MPFDITEDESWEVIHLRGQGLSLRKIEEKLNGKHRRMQISRVLDYYARYGEPPKYRQHKRPKQEREKALDDLARDRLECIYDEDPSLYLDEATKKLNTQFGYHFSEWAVDRALILMKLTLKEVHCFIFIN